MRTGGAVVKSKGVSRIAPPLPPLLPAADRRCPPAPVRNVANDLLQLATGMMQGRAQRIVPARQRRHRALQGVAVQRTSDPQR